MTPAFVAAFSDHLWQSTIVVAVVGLLTLLLRRNRAQVRYALWLVASLKFLVPFAWLEALGQRFQRESAPAAVQQGLLQAIETVSQPFASLEFAEPASLVAAFSLGSMLLAALGAVWLGGCVLHLVAWRLRWCRVAALAAQAAPALEGRGVAILRRLEQGRFRRPLAMVVSPQTVEPAVFGVWRPVLLWPRGLEDRLGDAHLEALLAHELCHVRRRDNLAMTLHMLVEAVFWFHPLVWWVERRLIDERERACDEDVVRLGGDPRVYAESILKTSELCVESPLACAAGITGSDLKTRIEAIMQRHPCRALGGWRQLLLWSTAGMALAIPLSLGVLDVPLLRAQAPATGQGPAFEVASVKPTKSDEVPASFGLRPGGQLVVVNNTLFSMIRNAYQLQEYQIVGGPNWINDDRFDVNAKAAGDTPPLQILAMSQTLLADRFKLVVHRETRQLPIYALVMARSDRRLGPRLQPGGRGLRRDAGRAWTRGAGVPSDTTGPTPTVRHADGARPDDGRRLSAIGRREKPRPDCRQGCRGPDRALGHLRPRPRVDARSDAPGAAWGPARGAAAAALGRTVAVRRDSGAAGLKLDATRGPVEVLVIDSAERPSPD